MEGCSGRHFELLYKVPVDSDVVANTMCKVHDGETNSNTMKLQRVMALDINHYRVEAKLLFDSGASFVVISEAFCNKLQLRPVKRVVCVALGDGQVVSYKKVKLRLVDRDERSH